MDAERLLKMKRDLDEAVDAVFIYLEDLHDTGIYRCICIYMDIPVCMYVIHVYSHSHAITRTAPP